MVFGEACEGFWPWQGERWSEGINKLMNQTLQQRGHLGPYCFLSELLILHYISAFYYLGFFHAKNSYFSGLHRLKC